MRGIIGINILDAKTLEVLQTIETLNIVTTRYIADQLHVINRFSDLFINITDAPYKSSLMGSYHNNNSASLGHLTNNLGFYFKTADRQIGDTPYITTIHNTNTEPFIVEYASRFDPPAIGTTRTIRTVYMGAGGWTYAFSELGTPCIQTDQQVMDIRYRILFDYDEGSIADSTQVPMTRDQYYDYIKGFGTYPSNQERNYLSSQLSSQIVSSFPKLKIKPSDRGIVSEGFNVVRTNTPQLGLLASKSNVINMVHGAARATAAAPIGLEENVGSIIASMSLYKSSSSSVISKLTPMYRSNVFNRPSKIQNIIGYSIDSTNPNNSMFMSVDTLPLGTGRCNITGPWLDAPLENDPATIASGLYYKTHLPRRDIITIVNPGPVGQATYRYSTQGFVRPFDTSITDRNNQTHETIPDLTSFETINADKSLIGRLTNDNFTIEQLTATISYDGSSVAIPRKDRILLYSIAESNYWFITGTFTDIHQLDVQGDWIFIACKNTGLYRVNPKQSLIAEKVTIGTTEGALWTSCRGVAVTDTKIWAMASNMLVGMSMDALGVLVFTDRIDHTSVAPFILPGDTTSLQTIQKIAYIKADKSSSTYRLFCVFDHSAVPADTGFFLSSAGVTVFTGYVTTSNTQLKFNRSSIGFVNGRLFYYSSNNLRHRGFGETTESVMSNAVSLFQSVLSVKNISDGSEHILHQIANSNTKVSFSMFNAQTLTMSRELLPNNPLSSLHLSSPGGNDAIHNLQIGVLQPPTPVGDTRSNQINLMLENGVVFGMGMSRDPLGNNLCYGYLFLAGLDRTPHGGSSRWISRKDYGWNGSNWVEGHSGARTTSLTPSSLLEGLSVSFENGAVGTSFVANEFYKFGLCKGLMKDNITQFAYTLPVYSCKTATKKFALGTVALLTGQTTPIVLHPNHRSKDSHINANGEIVLPGYNIGQYATAVQRLVGNFEISFPLVNKDSPNINSGNIEFGVGFRRFNKVMAGFRFIGATTLFSMHATNRNPRTALDASSFNIPTTLTTDIIRLQKSGSTFTVRRNSTLIGTYSAPSIQSTDVVLDIITNNRYDHAGMVPGRACPAISIISNGSATYLDFPIQFTDDVNCHRVSEHSPVIGYLDGVMVPTKIDGSLPAPGEISVVMEGLYAVFNEADIGKTAEIECTLVYHT